MKKDEIWYNVMKYYHKSLIHISGHVSLMESAAKEEVPILHSHHNVIESRPSSLQDDHIN